LVVVHLTNGFGNNIFQYVAGRLLSTYHNQELVVIPPHSNYYADPDLEDVNIELSDNVDFNVDDCINVDDNNYLWCFDKKYKEKDFKLKGYFENWRFYFHHIDLIKSWFPKVENRNDNDLVIHFRTGDRLFYKNEFDSKPRVDSYLKAIDKFNFDKLHIVTDMYKWDYINIDEVKSMKFHHNHNTSECVEPQMVVDYFNSFVDGFSKYNPIMENRKIVDDFNFIRTFKNILFQYGTLGWWASVLSEATKVGVYGPWRSWKNDKNKNLSEINLEGWFKWE
jgi:hypothetical protein